MANDISKFLNDSGLAAYSQLLKQYIDANSGGSSGSSDSNIVILEDGQYDPDTHEPTIDGEIGNIYIVPVFEDVTFDVLNKSRFEFPDTNLVKWYDNSNNLVPMPDDMYRGFQLTLGGTRYKWNSGSWILNLSDIEPGYYEIVYKPYKSYSDHTIKYNNEPFNVGDKISFNSSEINTFEFAEEWYNDIGSYGIYYVWEVYKFKTIIVYTYTQYGWNIIKPQFSNGLSITRNKLNVNTFIEDETSHIIDIYEATADFGIFFQILLQYNMPDWYVIGTNSQKLYYRVFTTVIGSSENLYNRPTETHEPTEYIQFGEIPSGERMRYALWANSGSTYYEVKDVTRVELYYSRSTISEDKLNQAVLVGLWEPESEKSKISQLHISDNNLLLNNIVPLTFDQVDINTGEILIEGIENNIYLKPRTYKKYTNKDISEFPKNVDNGYLQYNSTYDYFYLSTSYSYSTYVKALIHFPKGNWLIKYDHVYRSGSSVAGYTSLRQNYKLFTFDETDDTIEVSSWMMRSSYPESMTIDAYKITDLAPVVYKNGKWIELGAVTESDDSGVPATGVWESGEISSWATYQVNRAIRFITIDINGVNTTSSMKDIEATVPEEFRPNHWINVPCFVQASPIGTAKVFYDVTKGCIHVYSSSVGTIYGQISWNY